jgi:hypothetical protein
LFFSRTCSFPLLYILCTYNVKQSFMKTTWGSPISWNFPAHFGPKVSRFAAKSFMKVNSVNLGCKKSNFVSITWVFYFILKRYHETFVDCL